MVLESNRDLVLRRLTEALARDRTRHQVSEVTSLGLVQLTRKRLGTGLIEAFSTSCTHCGGRGIVLHGDPVDSVSAGGGGRKSEPASGSGRRSKRGKKTGKPEDVPVVKVPDHPAGEHPMFKAMAAANGRHHDDESPDEHDEHDEHEELDDLESAEDGVVETAHGDDTAEQVARETAEEDLDDEDSDDEDSDDEDDVDSDEDDDTESDEDEDDDEADSDDESDEDEIDLDSDDEEVDIDDDIEVIDDDSDDEDDHEVELPQVITVARRPRRRAAARPAGPPAHE
jgi:ribonuclease E